MPKKKVEDKLFKETWEQIQDINRDIQNEVDKERALKFSEEQKRKGGAYKDIPETVIKEGVQYIREDMADQPREFDARALFMGKRIWWNPTTWIPRLVRPKGSLLFLMDNDNQVKVHENVKSGFFRVKEFEGTRNERTNTIILKPNKQRSLILPDGSGFPCWVADINEFNALPLNPEFDAQVVSESIRKAVTDRKALESPKTTMDVTKYLKIAAIAAGIGYILYKTGVLNTITSLVGG